MSNIIRLPSVEFSYHKSARYNYVSLNELWDFDNHKPKYPIVGYCDNIPNYSIYLDDSFYSDYTAVMFETPEGDIWIHLPKEELKTYIENI